MEDVKTTSTTVEPAKKKASGFKKFMRKILVVLLLVVAVYVLLGYFYSFSEGFREGYVYKFSKKGLMFKTQEGILKTGFVNLGNTATPNEEWNFSVTDENVINTLNSAGERKFLKVYYKQRIVKLFWRGDTKYFVYKVEVLNDK